MALLNLRERPDLLPAVARWHHAEWQALYPRQSLADFEDDLRRSPADGALPQTWLWQEDDQACGTASLLLQDMATHPELSPWLANVFVRPEFRGQGIGRRLVTALMAEAARRGIPCLYLFTEDQQAFYERLGWRLLMSEPYEGQCVAIMQFAPAPPSMRGS